MGVLQNIGQGISDAVDWVGDKAQAAGTAVKDGAEVAWEKAENAGGTVAVLPGMAYAYVVDDAALPNPPGKIIGYPGHWAACEDVPTPITVRLPYEKQAQRAAAVASAPDGSSQATTVQTPASSFIYLDVGRWGGTGPDGKRDFGIVCGRTAVLCAFTTGSGGQTFKSFPSAKDTLAEGDGPSDEIGPINALLAQLAGTDLGAPKVRRVLTAKKALPPGVESFAQKVYVILGDMHLPAVTGVVPDDGKPPEQVSLQGKRVGRTRRTDMFKSAGTMSDGDAAAWHKCYIEGEIFKTAGNDLSLFAGQLRKAKGNVGAELWLLQLGDMFDLWLGFDRFFEPDPPKSSGRGADTGRVILAQGKADDAPTTPAADPGQPSLSDVSASTATTAVEFIDTWVKSTMHDTTEAAHVRDFLQFDPGASRFLHGNHDNYLARHVPSELMTLRGGQGMAKEFKDRSLIYACHGHQFDSSNRDGAVFGVVTTQTAFWGGEAIRKLEPDTRAPTILGPVSLLRRNLQDFAIFAMGHTHAALLTEVVIEMEPEPGAG